MRIRFFGSPICKDCLKIFVILEKFQVDYKYFDGHDIENDEIYDICEEQNVDELPHLQFLDNNNNIIVEHVGPMTEKEFTTYLKDNFHNY